MRALAVSLGVLCLLAGGCGKTKYDIYLEGAKIEGDAERGPCKLHYAKDAQAAELTGDNVALCLKETERALALYEQAASMGYDDADFLAAHERAKGRLERLKSMLSMVREMEREQNVGARL